LLPGSPASRDMVPDTVENSMAMAPNIPQAVFSSEQLGRPSEYQMHAFHPKSKKVAKKNHRGSPVVADIFDASMNTRSILIPPLRDLVNPDGSSSTEYLGYTTSTNGGNKGFDTGPLAVAPSAHPFSPTNAMIQFAAHIEKYGKQRAAEAEGRLKNVPAVHLSSKSVAKHPNFPSEVLQRIAVRRNPKIQISGLDLSCAFMVCDLTQSDLPIIYASNACKKLTGYTRDEIVGRNFRFMLFRNEQWNSGVLRPCTDSLILRMLQSHITSRSEYQIPLISYKKQGQLFKNLLTCIPIRWDGGEYRFYVGFVIEIGEHWACVSGMSSDEYFAVNYSQTKTSNPVDQSDDESDDESEQEETYMHKRWPTPTPVSEPADTSPIGDPRTQISRAASDPGGTALINHIFQRSTNPTYDAGTPTDQQASMPHSNAPAEQTALLSVRSPEADSPWSEGDGLPPPYALSPGVFYHTSRMVMLSP
jgi:PAS domain S-box-containing protein